MTPIRSLVATYRLQLHKDFRFQEAAQLIDYLSELGISHLYLSPILTSRPGSTHGYDNIDPSTVSRERGSEKELKKLLTKAEQTSPPMQVILDIVPNHMAASFDNPIWRDLLMFGMRSAYADFFDLRLQKNGAFSRVFILPVLGDDLTSVLMKNEIQLDYQANRGFFFRYYDHLFPVGLVSYPEILLQFLLHADHAALMEHEKYELEQIIAHIQHTLLARRLEAESDLAAIANWFSKSLLRLHLIKEFVANASSQFIASLLKEQHYHLEYWRTGSSRVNYRRFFDINDLVTTKVEQPAVFEVLHRKIHRLLKNNPALVGLRVDHIDGLYDPKAYLAKLNEFCGTIWVEKILGPHEHPDPDWPIAGTTGYESLNKISQLFIDPQGFKKLLQYHAKINPRWSDFDKCVDESKREVLNTLFVSDMNYFSRNLRQIAKSLHEPLGAEAIRTAIGELTTWLPFYRTYIDQSQFSKRDTTVLERAFKNASRRLAGEPLQALIWLKMLLLDNRASLGSMKIWVQQWQQFTGSVAAKGIEDTAFYRHVPLISLNEVGGSPKVFDNPVFHFHFANKKQLKTHPRTLNASSTHDTKRSEDVRARIHVLTEMADVFIEHVNQWTELNQPHKTSVQKTFFPDRGFEWFIYQTLVGAWPINNIIDEHFIQRVQNACIKAARESKTATSWINQNEDYEKALIAFVRSILNHERSSTFIKQMSQLATKVAFFGALNSLSMLALKALSPGVPDFYQGCESWNLCLVDPDNRRPVDYASNAKILRQINEMKTKGHATLFNWLALNWKNGGIKLWLTQNLLSLRAQAGPIFHSGNYIPLSIEGDKRSQLIAFALEHEGEWIVAIVPRFFSTAPLRKSLRVNSVFWRNIKVVLPLKAPREWQNYFSKKSVLSRQGKIRAERVLQGLPVILTHFLR